VIHQLRIYELFEKNKVHFHTRFRNHASRIMRKHGFRILAMWDSETDATARFAYLLSWHDIESKDAAWAAFMADPEWAEIKRTTGARYGDLVGAIEDRILTPTRYSPRLL